MVNGKNVVATVFSVLSASWRSGPRDVYLDQSHREGGWNLGSNCQEHSTEEHLPGDAKEDADRRTGQHQPHRGWGHKGDGCGKGRGPIAVWERVFPVSQKKCFHIF